MSDAFVDFYVMEFLKHDVAVAGIEIATTEAVCMIVDQLARNAGLKYDIDYKFETAYFDHEGQRRAKFWFKDEQTAFMVKLKGFEING